jgi:hypothetical protein
VGGRELGGGQGVAQPDAAQAPVVGVEANDGRFNDRDADRLHACKLVGGDVVRAVAEQDDIV